MNKNSQSYQIIHGAPCACGKYDVHYGSTLSADYGRELHTAHKCSVRWEEDADKWYAAEVRRMKDRSPA